MKIKFNSNDNLPLNKPLEFHLMTIAIRSVSEEDGKLYQQVFLDNTLHELNAYKMLVVFYDFFLFFFFLLYIKMSDITDLTYYQKNRNIILNKAKDYYKNNKERLRDHAREKYKILSEEEKNLKKYGKNRYHNMSEDQKIKTKRISKKL